MGGQASSACDQVLVTEDWLRNSGQADPYLLCCTTHWQPHPSVSFHWRSGL